MPQKMMVAVAQAVAATAQTILQALQEVRLLSAHVRASVWSASVVLLAATLTRRESP